MNSDERAKWDMDLSKPLPGQRDYMSADDEMKQLEGFI
jgi:hypothetical protein